MDATFWYGCAAAVLVGMAKTGVPGIGILVVPIMAVIVGDAKQSVGVLLPMLIMADIWAVIYYKKHAQWNIIIKLSPWIITGLVLGGMLLRIADREIFAPILGGLVLVVLVLELVRLRYQWKAMPHHPAFTALMGTGTGVATMMGNVAGPIANIYLLSKGLKKEHFMGSMAWLFLMINLLKVPWFWHLKMITPETLKFNLMLIPAITIGAFCGKPCSRIFPSIFSTSWYWPWPRPQR